MGKNLIRVLVRDVGKRKFDEVWDSWAWLMVSSWALDLRVSVPQTIGEPRCRRKETQIADDDVRRRFDRSKSIFLKGCISTAGMPHIPTYQGRNWPPRPVETPPPKVWTEPFADCTFYSEMDQPKPNGAKDVQGAEDVWSKQATGNQEQIGHCPRRATCEAQALCFLCLGFARSPAGHEGT
jgi:hypothetical protein